MVNTREFTFPSADGRTEIHAVEWQGEEKPRAVVQLAHGVSEYALRYRPLAEFLVSRGFAVIANDHLGHGQSVAPGAAAMYFGDSHGWLNVVRDMGRLHDDSAARHPDAPHFLLGHSMGSFLARTFLIRYPRTVRGAILMGTAQQSAVSLTAGRLAAELAGQSYGFDRSNATINDLAFGAYGKAFRPNRTPFDWLSANPENVDAYIADPLCGRNITVGLFRDMLIGIRYNQKPENLAKMDRSTPVLFVSGAQDPVGDMGRGVQLAYESFVRAGVTDATLKLYPGMRHEILNERDRASVYEDLLRWLESRL